MQLEKATSHSGEAGLAGWISSNDVTLFTMVLVVVIAMFLHTKLVKGTKENEQLSGEKAALSENLASTEDELDAASDLLDRTSEQLDLTQEDRDKIRKQLVAELQKISALNGKVDALLKEKGQLETERDTLASAKRTLTAERSQLMSERESLTKERSTLKKSKATLSERLDAITGQLADKLVALGEVEKERDRLKSQADELDTIVAGLKKKLDAAEISVADMKKEADAARDASKKKLKQMEAKVASGDKQAQEYLARLKEATELFEGLKLEKRKLETALSAAEQRYELQLLRETTINRELVGIQGKLKRVAILFDASGSMKEPANGRDQNRWAEAQDIAATWLKHLDVDGCVLIVFSTDVRTFPEDGSVAELRGEDAQSKRDELLEHLQAVSPTGWTNTGDALRKAYAYEGIDTIVLFSDGAPTRPQGGRFDASVAEEIYDLCREHPEIPVNTVGLGNYFDKDTSTFLKTVASITGGTFRGR